MDSRTVKKNSKIMLVLIGIIFLMLVARLAYLQIYQQEQFLTKAQQNHMRLIPIQAPRGAIFAQDGETKLVSNKPVYTVSLVYLGLKNTQVVIEQLSEILNMSVAEIQQKLDEQNLRLYEPVKIAKDVPLETVLAIEQYRLELPGVVIDVEPVRDYPLEEMGSQVLGFVRGISAEDLERVQAAGKDYLPNDELGKSGLEAVYEDYLRGVKGAHQVEVDSAGRPIQDLGLANPVPGNNLILTLDHELQAAAEETLARQIQALQKSAGTPAKAGSVVVLDVETAGVLAMANYPTYNPEVFVGLLPADEWQRINEEGALTNRAIESIYPPGSTFKPLVGIAGLASGAIKPGTKLYDPGYYNAGGRMDVPIWDWQRRAMGHVDLYQSLRESINTYFCDVGVQVGQDILADYAKQFGLGIKLGVDLTGEKEGTVPSPDVKYIMWKRNLYPETLVQVEAMEEKYQGLYNEAADELALNKLKNQFFAEINEIAKDRWERSVIWEMQWHLYDTAFMSIGQGDSKYTPLQLASFTATIANGGKLLKPHLVQKITDQDGKTIKKFSPETVNQANISETDLAAIREGMRQVAGAARGTASTLFTHTPVTVGAKTGTAEFFVYENGKRYTQKHGLMIAFAPAENPKIAVACVIENGGSGSGGAGPVVRDVINAYFGAEAIKGQPVVHGAE